MNMTPVNVYGLVAALFLVGIAAWACLPLLRSRPLVKKDDTPVLTKDERIRALKREVRDLEGKNGNHLDALRLIKDAHRNRQPLKGLRRIESMLPLFHCGIEKLKGLKAVVYTLNDAYLLPVSCIIRDMGREQIHLEFSADALETFKNEGFRVFAPDWGVLHENTVGYTVEEGDRLNINYTICVGVDS